MNMDDEQFEDVLTTNLRGAFWLLRAVSRRFVRTGAGASAKDRLRWGQPSIAEAAPVRGGGEPTYSRPS